MTLQETIECCCKQPELIREYERVRGVKLRNRSPIESLVDEATGYRKEKWMEFFDFIRDYIWMPVLLDSLGKIPEEKKVK